MFVGRLARHRWQAQRCKPADGLTRLQRSSIRVAPLATLTRRSGEVGNNRQTNAGEQLRIVSPSRLNDWVGRKGWACDSGNGGGASGGRDGQQQKPGRGRQP
ncbi:MAG TPA: hypothetical protein VJ464_01930 [Blastocatellia bacterium]|nr:hypothetical protein [Blastocatellia bacterium]